MEIQIKIGKEETGPKTITVPSTCKRVSRHHAKLLWKDGILTIEDNESTNGTFVNGKRIAKTKVTENDTVWLGGVGGNDHYQVDVKKVFSACRESEEKQRTDYSKEFEDIKQAYIEYKAEESKLKNSQNVKMRVVNFIPLVVGGLCTLLGGPGFIGLAVGIVVTLILLSKSSKHDINDQITELQIKYQPRYCCPKCGTKFPLTTHWRKLEADGKCPNPKCNAEFVKKSSKTTDV